MVAGPLVAQSPIDDDEIWRRARSYDLTGRREADEQPAAAREQFFRHQNCERRTNDPSDNPDLLPGKRECIQFRVITGPIREASGFSALPKGAHNVAVGVENAYRRHLDGRELLLAPRLAQQRGRQENGR